MIHITRTSEIRLKYLQILNLIVRHFSILSFTLAVPLLARSSTVRVIERGTNVPLSQASLLIEPDVEMQTDRKGEIDINWSSPKTVKLIVVHPDFERYEGFFEVGGTAAPVVIRMSRQSQNEYRTTVRSKKIDADMTQKSLSQEEFLAVPGAAQDPVKAVQNLPGVNRASGFSSQIVIQGSAPGDSRYLIDGVEVPIIFHFGGLSSVVIPQSIAQVDYYSAGYGPRYSRAMGGVIELKTKDVDLLGRKRKGFFFVDTLNTGGMYEQQIDENRSFSIGGRFSYIGTVIKAVMKNQEALNLTVAPEFSDLTGIYNHKIDSTKTFKFVATGSTDRLAFVFNEPVRDNPAVRGAFNNQTSFYRLIPQFNWKIDDKNSLAIVAGYGEDRLKVEVGDQFFKLHSSAYSFRTDYSYDWSDTYKLKMGMDHLLNDARVSLKLPLNNTEGGVGAPIGSREQLQYDRRIALWSGGFYLKNDIYLNPKLLVSPSARLDSFRVSDEIVASPRLSTAYKLDEWTTWSAAMGLYYQPPQPQESLSGIGNPDVKAPRVWHYTVGLEKDFKEGRRDGFSVKANVFDRQYDRLVVGSSSLIVKDGQQVAEVYNNSGRGRSYGFDQILKAQYEKWNGWISYTLLKSTRRDPKNGLYNAQYDQTHNFNIVVARDLPSQWKVSTRFRYVTGNRYTPVDSARFDSDQDAFIPLRGPIYSRRLKDFYQLDVRVDKKWTLDTQVWSLYLDIQNVLNTKNPESLNYSYDFSQNVTVSGLPILPAFGVRGEF